MYVNQLFIFVQNVIFVCDQYSTAILSHPYIFEHSKNHSAQNMMVCLWWITIQKCLA